MRNDDDYYRGRATEERQRAADGTDSDIAGIHLELAKLYELRVADPAAWTRLSSQESR